MLLQFFAAAAITALLFLLCWLLRGVMLTPVKTGSNTSLKIILAVTGTEPMLEQTVDSVLWLMENGTISGEIILHDCGMDTETAAVAEALVRRGAVKIID